MARSKKYKCGYCKNEINLEKEDEQSYFFIVDEKRNTRKCFHCDCFVEYQTSKKKKPLTVDECIEKIDQYRALEKQYEDKIQKKENLRNQLFEYVMDMYDLTFVPSYFYVRMSEVFNGSYKGLSKPVPPEDLLDMWKQKRNFLLQNAEKQRKRDKNIDGISRVWYDMSILLSRYDAYLDWKEKKKLAMIDIEEKKKESIDFVKYNDIVKNSNTKKENNAIDINSMLDEI